MSTFFKKNDFRTDYKKRPNDSYKAVLEKLDEETKRKIDRQRTIGMIVIVVFVFLFIVILAVSGIGVDKTKSVSGNIFADKESVLIECFGDSITAGFNPDEESGEAQTSYPQELSEKITELFDNDGNSYKCKSVTVKNYGMNGSVLKEDSCSRLSGEADIVIILYPVNNFLYNEEYVGTLEANIETIVQQGSQVFVLNYPVHEDSEEIDAAVQANNYISSTVKSLNLQFIDLCTYFENIDEYSQSELFSSDLVHLSNLGYKLLGDYVAEQIHEYYYNNY